MNCGFENRESFIMLVTLQDLYQDINNLMNLNSRGKNVLETCQDEFPRESPN